MNARNNAISFLKGIACICVMFIHHRFPVPVNHYVLSVGRAAVPFFFMVSGYYFYNEKNRRIDIVMTKVGYFLRLGAVMICIYAIKNIIESCILNDARVTEVLLSELSIKGILNFIALNDSPFSGMAWYLFAAAYVYIIAGVMYDKKMVLYILTPFLLICHLLLARAGFEVHCQMNWLFSACRALLLAHSFVSDRVAL